jgi:molybdopterin converting factor small subunit
MSVMATGTIRYWAAARAAAGTETDTYRATTLAEALEVARAARGPEFARVLSVCSYLIDGDPVGLRDHAAVELPEGATVEVLPPFAGG